MGVVEMSYVRMSKPLALLLYERVRDVVADAWVGKEAAKKEQTIQAERGISAVHWDLCHAYHAAKSAGKPAYEFSLIQIDLKEGDAASIFAPLEYNNLELAAVTSSPKHAGFFVPARDKDAYVKKLHERFKAVGARAYVAASDLRVKCEDVYTAMPKSWDEYQLIDTRPQAEAPALEQPREFKVHVERKPLELGDLVASYAA